MKWVWIGLGVSILCGSLIYTLGSVSGSSDVQALWDADREATDRVINDLRLTVAAKEAAHTLLSKENSDALAKSQAEHAKALDAVRTDYAKRLLSVETRAGVYKRMSDGTAIERNRLVEHTAQLDRTLEEGRHLVGELRETLGQCEITVGVLGTQILLDRDLLK